jgi:type I restriction enzyme S subunit
MKEYFLEGLLQIKNGRDHKHLPDGNIPVYGSGGFMRFVNQAIYNDESILLPRKGTLSNIQFTNKPFWTVDTIYYTIINKEKANPLYLYHYLKQLDLSYLNSGTGVPSMTFGVYYGIKVQLPSLSNQQKIAKVLSDLDAKIELNNKINAELEAMAKTLYDYWFVQFDFPNEDGKPYKSSGGKMVLNEELKREIPEGWEVKDLKQILYTVNESIEPDQYPDLKYLPIDKLPSRKLYYQEYTDRENANSSLIKFNEDDILLGAMRVYFHRVCNAIEDGISRSTIMVLRAFNTMHKNYGLFTLSTDEAIDFANKNSTGTSIPYAKWENGLSNYKVVCPSKNLLDEFNALTNPILNKFKILSKENQELASLRDWLLPMLMNGQVSVASTSSATKDVYEVEERELGLVAEGGVKFKNV